MTLNELIEKALDLQKKGFGDLPVAYYAPISLDRHIVEDIINTYNVSEITLTGIDEYWKYREDETDDTD
jgi:hypothetical protein